MSRLCRVWRYSRIEATGVFSSWVTAWMNAPCCSFRRISRTRKIVLSTTPVMMSGKARAPRISIPASRQLTMTQPMLSARAPADRRTPRTMKKAMDFRRPPDVIRHSIDLLGGDLLFGGLAGPGGPDVPDQPDGAKALQFDPGEVEFVPGQAVARRGRVGVVVVVPAFAERQERHPPHVLRVVSRREAAAPPQVRGGVDEPRRVQSDHHAQEDRPVDERPSTNGEERESQHGQRYPVKRVQPAVKGVSTEVRGVAPHERRVVVVGLAEENPSQVRPERAYAGRVRVERLVGMLMMQA